MYLVFRFLLQRVGTLIGFVYFGLIHSYQLWCKVIFMKNGFYPTVADQAQMSQFARCVILTMTLYQSSAWTFLLVIATIYDANLFWSGPSLTLNTKWTTTSVFPVNSKNCCSAWKLTKFFPVMSRFSLSVETNSIPNPSLCPKIST